MLKLIKALPKLAATPNRYNAVHSAWNLKQALPDGLFHHPAPAAPLPLYETPNAFLPDSDPRKNLPHMLARYEVTPEAKATMPLVLRETAPARGPVLTQAEAVEVARLRREEPARWTVPALSERFKVLRRQVVAVCSQLNRARGVKEEVREPWQVERLRVRQGKKREWRRDV